MNHHSVFYHFDIVIAVSKLGVKYLQSLVDDWESTGDRSELLGKDLPPVELEEAIDATYIKTQQKLKSEPKTCQKCGAAFNIYEELMKHMIDHRRWEEEEEARRKAEHENKRKYFEQIKQEENLKKNEEEFERTRRALFKRRQEEEVRERMTVEESAKAFIRRQREETDRRRKTAED